MANAGAVDLNGGGARLSFTTLAIAIGLVPEPVRAIGSGIGPLLPEKTAETFDGRSSRPCRDLLWRFDAAWVSIIGLALGRWTRPQLGHFIVQHSNGNTRPSAGSSHLPRLLYVLHWWCVLCDVGRLFVRLFRVHTAGAWATTAMGVAVWCLCFWLSRLESKPNSD